MSIQNVYSRITGGKPAGGDSNPSPGESAALALLGILNRTSRKISSRQYGDETLAMTQRYVHLDQTALWPAAMALCKAGRLAHWPDVCRAHELALVDAGCYVGGLPSGMNSSFSP